MNRTQCRTLVVAAILLLWTGPAMAMYHPAVGRWLQREPGGAYRDGMSLYAAYFVASATDPFGLDTREVKYHDYPGIMGGLRLASYERFPSFWDRLWGDLDVWSITLGRYVNVCGGGYLLETSQYGYEYDYIVSQSVLDQVSGAYGKNEKDKILDNIMSMVTARKGIKGHIDRRTCSLCCDNRFQGDDIIDVLAGRANFGKAELADKAQKAYTYTQAAYAVTGTARMVGMRPLAHYAAPAKSVPQTSNAYRYVNADEAATAARTGRVPNVNPAGDPKSVYITPDYYDSSACAQRGLQLGGPPTHRIAVTTSAARPTYAGNVAGSPANAIEMTVNEELPVTSIRPLEP